MFRDEQIDLDAITLEGQRIQTIYDKIRNDRKSNATEEREDRIRQLSDEIRLRNR